MSSDDNIFKTKSTANYKVSGAGLYKERPAPRKQPFQKPKAKSKPKKNSLWDVTMMDLSLLNKDATLLDKIIQFILALIGKQKEWQETKFKLNTLKNRISQFESAINQTKDSNYPGRKFKDYNI